MESQAGQIWRRRARRQSDMDIETKFARRDLDVARDSTDAALFQTPWGTHQPRGLQAALIWLTRATFLQRGDMRRWMTSVIRSLNAPMDIQFRGLKWRIEARNNLIEYGLLTRPSYNGEEIDFLLGALAPGGTAIDIGCNIGLYALPLANHAGPDGTVLAIDANPDMVTHVNFHAKANSFSQLKGLNLAVGGKAAQVDLRIMRDDVAIVAVEESDSGSIAMRPLAEIISNHGVTQIDALKIDIEGHEDEALAPFIETAPDSLLPKRIVIEFLPPSDYPGCAAAFAARGYRLVGRTRNNSMYARD